MAITKEYLNQAIDMLSGNKTNEITQNNTAFKTNLQSLEGQKAGTNQNFDKQLEQNTINTTKSQNNYLNNSLSRGLGRSTIATSGAAGIQDSGNKIANVVEQDRAIAVNNIEAQKTILQQNLQATLLGLESSYDSQAQTLGQQLEAQAYARQMERESFDYKKSQDVLDESFRQSQFAYQKQQDALDRQLRASGSGSGGSGSSGRSSSSSSNTAQAQATANTGSSWDKFDNLLGQYYKSTKNQGALSSYIDSFRNSNPEMYKLMNGQFQSVKSSKVNAQTVKRTTSGKVNTVGQATSSVRNTSKTRQSK